MNRIVRTAALATACFALVAAAPKASLFDDNGTLRVYHRDRVLGTEDFSFETHGDSVFVFSHIHEVMPSPSGQDSVVKHIAMALARQDLELRGYESNSRIAGHVARRRLDLEDTTFTSYLEDDNGGEGRAMVRPPGRMFVIEPRAFALFDLVFRSMHGSALDERPVNVLYLGVARDTVIEARIRRLGPESIRWGARLVQAQKYSLSDNASEFVAWTLPDGRMVRLAQPNVGLRVERLPPGARR